MTHFNRASSASYFSPNKSSAVIRALRLLPLLFIALVATPSQAAFNMETGNAAKSVVQTRLNPILQETWGPGCASVIFRALAIVGNGWFDAIAPYNPTAVGIYTNMGHRPASEGVTNTNRNIALLYASYRVLNSLFPAKNPEWRSMMTSAGLNPDDQQSNTVTAIGIGNMAGNAVVAARESDGMNQLGNEGGCLYNCLPYADYTGYTPVNSAYELLDAGHWQPYFKTKGNGIFTAQMFVTPQYALTKPYSYDDPNEFVIPAPVKSDPSNVVEYKAQADEVIAASAGLTDFTKMRAEHFDNKYRTFGGASVFITGNRGLALEQFVQYFFLSNLAAFDAGIAAWNEKARYDAPRPFTAISFLYGDSPLTAWGGPGKGIVSDIPANQWRQYLSIADHPEYPSGSATFCHAFAQASRRYFGSDTFGMTVKIAPGMSVVEPGVSPVSQVVMPFPTWTDWAEQCGQSRVDGGVHFPESVEVGPLLGIPIADRAYDFVMNHINGVGM